MSPHPLWSRAGFAAGASLVALCTSLITSGAASASTTTTTPAASTVAKTALKGVCAAPTTINQEQCQVFLQSRAKKASGLSAADTSPVAGAYSSADLQSAYDLASDAAADGAGTTVSIVDAYRDPNVVSDLAAYRSQADNDLPACSTTTGDGCVTAYNETGGSASSVPVDPTGGWEVEESLDVDMVSAVCPLCKIHLYEANSTSLTDLGTAENTAAKASKFVSNSWGGEDYPGESAYDTLYFNHPGVVTAFASGDYGYGAGYPASSQLVTSVGGTDLTGSAGDWSQTVWNNDDGATESGCSSGEPKPAWQTDSECANRTENDVSAVADGPDGISIYDSYDSSTTCGGWCAVGGTSAATPIITSVYALAGTPTADTYPSSYLYQNEGAGLTRITSGNDSVTADGSTYTCESDRQYLCDAADSLPDGYNGPTGWGTPDGADLSAFTNTSTDVVSAINPGTYDLQAGVSYALPAIKAYDSDGNAVTYSATGLPSGLTINSSTGAISGKLSSTPATSAVTVTVSDGSAASNISFDIVSIASLDTDYHAVAGAVHLDLDGKCMDDTNNSSANLNKVQIYTCNGEASQNWTYEPDTEPGAAGVVEHNGKCLDVHRGGTTNGTLLDLYSCNGSGSQQWYLTGDGGELYNPQSGKCAEDPYSSTVNGRQLDIWTCNGGDNQAWTVPASPVQSGVTGKCLDDKGASSANGNVIDSYACNGQASQKWTLGLDETLEVEGKCLDATGLGTTDGTLAQLWSCNDGVNQLWYLTGTGEIENLNSEKCLANPGNSTTNDTRLELEDCTGQAGEIWAQS
jgi:hypothetical protein